MKVFNAFPLFCLLLHAFQAKGQNEFTSPYNGKNITVVVGNPVQFTWSYSGRSGGIYSVTCGLKKGPGEGVDPSGVFLSKECQTGKDLAFKIPQSYSGRISVNFSGDQSSGQISITLYPVKSDDEKHYGCLLAPVDNFQGEVFDYVNLVVQGPPNITVISPNTTVNEGETVILNCSAPGNLPANITWTKDERVVNFPLRDIDRGAAGLYRCTAVNGVGSPATADVFITVQYKPTIKSTIPLLVTQSWTGEQVSLQCVADGVPLPTIIWKRPDGSPIKSVRTTNNSVTALMQNDTDFGNYTCEALNGVGADTHYVHVKQLKAPGTPNISVTTEATSLTVRWVPPSYDGGSAITGYLVEVVNGTQGISSKRSTSSISRDVQVANLQKNTIYSVRVYAKNKVSFGKAAEIFAKTKFVGPPTTVISNCEVKGNNISISWKQPDNNGAVITEYKVYQRRGNEEEWRGIKNITENNFTHKYVVTDLDKGKEYEFLITARNRYGESIKEGNCERVKVPGGVPEAVKTTCNEKDGKAILTWKTPGNNGAAITGYKVYQRRENRKKWSEIETIVNNSTHKYVVRQVEKGEEYDFVVTATNEHGESFKNGICKGVRIPEGSKPTTETQTGGINTVVVAGGAVTGVLLIVGVVIFAIWWKRRKSPPDDASSSGAALRSDNPYDTDDGYQDVSASVAARGLQAESGPVAEPDYAQVDMSKKERNKRPVTDEYAQVDKSKKSKKPRKQPGELDYAELDDFRPSVQPAAAAAEAAPARPLIRRPAYEGTEYADITQFGVPQPEPTYGNIPKKDVVYSNVQGLH